MLALVAMIGLGAGGLRPKNDGSCCLFGGTAVCMFGRVLTLRTGGPGLCVNGLVFSAFLALALGSVSLCFLDSPRLSGLLGWAVDSESVWWFFVGDRDEVLLLGLSRVSFLILDTLASSGSAVEMYVLVSSMGSPSESASST